MKLLNTRFLTVLITLAFLGFSVTAFAKGKPDKCPTWPDCEGGDGGTEPDPVSLDVYWEGKISEPFNRTCEPNNFTPNGNTGNYHCGLSVDNPILFSLGHTGVQTARKGDALLCEVFELDVTLTPDSSYQFYWFGPCSDTCDIEIYNWFGGEQVNSKTDDQADFIRVTAWAVADEPFVNSNPFVESRTLNIDKLEFSFYANGSNKKLATCEYSQDEDNLGTVTFNTSVLP